MAKLSEAEIRDSLQDLPGWVNQDGKLTKTFSHASFPEAIKFVNDVAHLAELAHHFFEAQPLADTILVPIGGGSGACDRSHRQCLAADPQAGGARH